MKPDPEEIIAATGPTDEIKRESARRTRRSFLVGGAASAAAIAAAYYLDHTPDADRIQSALRHTLNFNADVNRTIFRERGLAPTYRVDQAIPLRLNGTVGLDQTIDIPSWRLQLVGTDYPEDSPFFSKDVTAWPYKYHGSMSDFSQAEDVKSAPGNGKVSKTGAQQPPQQQSDLNPTGAVDSAAAVTVTEQFQVLAASMSKKRKQGTAEAGPSFSSLDIGTPGLLLSLDDLAKQLPRVDLVTEFKCVEGWSNVTHWSGFRLRDLLDLYPPERVKDYNDRRHDPRYLYMETPDGDYYGGFDLAAARHPQAMLVTHMHGEPLTQAHGAPLRLHMPTKYGYKQVKRIGLIAYTNLKPDDYWTKLGYDWYAGL